MALARLLGRPMSAAALTAALPLAEAGLTPDLFPRAAARAGLSARLLRRRLDEIDPLTLPCVLLLEGRQACVLVEAGASTCTVIQPEAGLGTVSMPRAELAARYAGHALFARPELLSAGRPAEPKFRAWRALVLGRHPASVAGLWRGRRGRGADQPVRAGEPAVHHERLRPRRAEQRDRDPVGARQRRAGRVRLRLPAQGAARLLRRHRRPDRRHQAGQRRLRAGDGPADGGPPGLGRRLRQRSARVREPARLLHLGVDHGPGRSAVPAAVHRRDLADRRPAGAGAGDRGAVGAGGRAAAAAAAEPIHPGQPARGRAEARHPGRIDQRAGDDQERRRREPRAGRLGARGGGRAPNPPASPASTPRWPPTSRAWPQTW